MRYVKLMALVGITLLAAFALSGCDELVGMLVDWVGSPYGYVKDTNGVGISGAEVEVYKGTTLVESVTTSGEKGYFTLSKKVTEKGGT